MPITPIKRLANHKDSNMPDMQMSRAHQLGATTNYAKPKDSLRSIVYAGDAPGVATGSSEELDMLKYAVQKIPIVETKG